jgi:hypothetical protein
VENNNVDNKNLSDNKEDNFINKSPNQANGGFFDYDSKNIYYINDGKLYSISRTGTYKKLLFDELNVSSFKIYKDKIYLLNYSSYKNEDFNILYSIDNNGENLKLIEGDDFHSYTHKLRKFILYKDNIYYLRDNYGDDGMLHTVFKYDIENKSSNKNFNILTTESSEPIEYNNKLYFRDGLQNDRLIEYNGDNIKFIVFNKENNHKEKYITSIQIVNGYIYYNSKNHISRDKLYESIKPEIILDNEDCMISSINVTKEYVFFINILRNEKNDVIIRYNRMKHDGSDLKTIFEDKFNTLSNIAPMSIYIIDNLIFYRLWETYEIKVMDFDGNAIDWVL